MTLHGRDRLEAHADTGLGADELGLRRFTRAVDRTDSVVLSTSEKKKPPAPGATGPGAMSIPSI